MNKITEYMIVSGISRTGLIFSVERYINAGWEPIGGITVDISTKYTTDYLQAMVKRKEVDGNG